jgi:hypothetical protein
VVAFDRHRNDEVHDVDTVMYHLALPKATVGYCVVRYTGAGAIMAAVSEMM